MQMKHSECCLWVSTGVLWDGRTGLDGEGVGKGDGTSHLDARLTLATVEKQLGNADEALRV